ncbi:uncharacterized protein LOC132901888 [Amyelois transitella]|uniref:uncharacterized protein LOC132901888 n=1 Tax=Amyelois transitella TaxID=680683 RepID=UPI00298FF836|nr:uncharacterized protein LOC132901888 [Amyelois transitella]
MSQTNIDPELLITLIEIRPILWDKTLENYKDNNLRTAAWREVCIVLREDFQELEEKERQSYAKMVVKKWNQIRDSWKRSLNAKKKINKSGSAAVNTKKYCYHDQLLFLKKNMDPAETQDSGGNKAADIEEGDTENPIQNEESENEPIIGSPGQENPAGGAKRLKRSVLPRLRLSVMDQKMASFIDHQMKSQPNTQNEDRNLSFFKSLLPTLASLNDDQILQFQAGVISLLQNIKSRNFNQWPSQQPSTFNNSYQSAGYFTPHYSVQSSPSAQSVESQSSDFPDFTNI